MQSPVDPSIYVQNVHNQISIILLWVDDILIASKTAAHLKTRLNSRFKMTDVGKLSWFLEIQFECEKNSIKMNQYRYIKILSKFVMADYKPRSTPCEMDITKTSDKVDLIDSKHYREIIGTLIYIMVATRLDICYTVTRLSQDLAKPNSFHLTKVKYIFKKHNQSVTNI